jgi:hypothetical protein
LARIRIHVENGTVTLLRYAELFGNLPGHLKHVRRYKCSVIRSNTVQRQDVFSRADQNMEGCLRIDVMKCNDAIILVRHLCRQFTIRNSAKETGFHMPNFQLALLKNTKRKRSTSDLRLYFNSDLCLHQCLIENVGEN